MLQGRCHSERAFNTSQVRFPPDYLRSNGQRKQNMTGFCEGDHSGAQADADHLQLDADKRQGLAKPIET